MSDFAIYLAAFIILFGAYIIFRLWPVISAFLFERELDKVGREWNRLLDESERRRRGK